MKKASVIIVLFSLLVFYSTLSHAQLSIPSLNGWQYVLPSPPNINVSSFDSASLQFDSASGRVISGNLINSQGQAVPFTIVYSAATADSTGQYPNGSATATIGGVQVSGSANNLNYSIISARVAASTAAEAKWNNTVTNFFRLQNQIGAATARDIKKIHPKGISAGDETAVKDSSGNDVLTLMLSENYGWANDTTPRSGSNSTNDSTDLLISYQGFDRFTPSVIFSRSFLNTKGSGAQAFSYLDSYEYSVMPSLSFNLAAVQFSDSNSGWLSYLDGSALFKLGQGTVGTTSGTISSNDYSANPSIGWRNMLVFKDVQADASLGYSYYAYVNDHIAGSNIGVQYTNALFALANVTYSGLAPYFIPRVGLTFNHALSRSNELDFSATGVSLPRDRFSWQVGATTSIVRNMTMYVNFEQGISQYVTDNSIKAGVSYAF